MQIERSYNPKQFENKLRYVKLNYCLMPRKEDVKLMFLNVLVGTINIKKGKRTNSTCNNSNSIYNI